MTPVTNGGANPDTTYRDAMREVIAAQWTVVWGLIPVVRKSEAPEAVHKLRVASRRLRAAMDVAPACFPRKWYHPLHQSAKAITKAMGEVRDYDVLLDALNRERETASAGTRPGIDHLIAKARKERKRARKTALRFIEDMESSKTRKETRRRFSGPSTTPTTLKNQTPEKDASGDSERDVIMSLDPDASLSTNARRVLAVRTDDLFAYAPIIPDASAIEQHHDARIATKRLRYTLELFPGVFGEDGAQSITQLQALQEALGELHDADVRIERIEHELAGLDDDAAAGVRKSLETLLDQERGNRAKHHDAVVADWRAMEDAGLQDRLLALAAPVG